MKPRAIALLLPCVLVACRGNDGPPGLANGVIGPAGGAIVTGDGGASLTVPAGALATDVALRIDAGQISIVPGYFAVGPAWLFSPPGTAFAVPATAVLTFDPLRVPGPATATELLVGWRSATGQVASITPTDVDLALGRATVEVEALGTFWVGAPDIVAPADLFPLCNADYYQYDSGLVLSVARTDAEPNFGTLEVVKLTLTRLGLIEGIYLDDRGGDLAAFGSWQVPLFQQRNDVPVLLIAESDQVGTSRTVVGSFVGFQPYGTSIGAWSGLEHVTTELLARGVVTTPLGTFDTVHVRIGSVWLQTPGGPGASSLELWLADGVGPVQLRFGTGPVEQAVAGAVCGAPIRGR